MLLVKGTDSLAAPATTSNNYADDDIVILQVSSCRFHVKAGDLKHASTYFRDRLPKQDVMSSGTTAPSASQLHITADGSIVVQADPDIFRHVVTYLQTGSAPLFYKANEGFDYGRYAALYQVALDFGIHPLADWVGHQKYKHAVTVVRDLQDCIFGHNPEQDKKCEDLLHTRNAEVIMSERVHGDRLRVVYFKKQTQVNFEALKLAK